MENNMFDDAFEAASDFMEYEMVMEDEEQEDIEDDEEDFEEIDDEDYPNEEE